MKYLVTGAAGFIGANIAQKLLDSGHQVTTIDNLSSGYEAYIPKHCLFIRGDLSDATSIDQLNCDKFDAILHIAGQSSGEVSFESPIYDINSNTVSTLRLLDYAVKTGCKRFIYASSMSVYGQQSDKEKFSEEDVVKPKSFYAVGKLSSELYLRIYKEQFGIDYTALRYFNVYGEGQNFSNLKQGIISIYLKQFIDDDFKVVNIKGSPNRFRDLSHIDDVTKVSIEAIDNQEFFNEIIKIGTGEKTTVQTMLDLIRHYLNSDKEIIISEGTPGDQFGIYANVEKLQSIYSTKFTSFDVGLKQIITKIRGNDE